MTSNFYRLYLAFFFFLLYSVTFRDLLVCVMNPGERLYTGCVNSAAAKTSQVLCHPLTLQRETDKQAKITPFRKYKCQS